MRLFVDLALASGVDLSLPPGAARHAQVRRVQPGDRLALFDGHGSDWPAEVLAVGRSEVRVRVGLPVAVDTELPLHVTVALGMPANERMDAVVEKATELGVAVIQPLHSERSVLRLGGERAEKKRAHWQAVAEAACEQCGRARVPVVATVRSVGEWLSGLADDDSLRLLLSLQPDAQPLPQRFTAHRFGPTAQRVVTLNGPEGGLTPDEEATARRAGFLPATLGRRVLRADTAPLAVLAALGWLDGTGCGGLSGEGLTPRRPVNPGRSAG
jgi:16S rRNA (uracil1498-N3)-methyltransferase